MVVIQEACLRTMSSEKEMTFIAIARLGASHLRVSVRKAHLVQDPLLNDRSFTLQRCIVFLMARVTGR